MSAPLSRPAVGALRLPRAGHAPALAAAAALLSASAAARAGSFDAQGEFHFDEAAVWTLDFEQGLPETDEPVELVESDSALSGSHVLSVGAYQQGEFIATVPTLPLTYRASVWVRGGEGAGFLVVAYSDDQGRADEISTLYPTGRLTSDGWVELANEGLRVDGARATIVAMGVFAPSGAEVDGLELVPDGEIEGVPNAVCDGAVDADACGVGQICMWSECRSVNGWVPPIPRDRDDVADYLEYRLRYLFGPYLERTLDLPVAATALAQMRLASDPWGYWNGFMLAVRRLHDGHTSTTGTASWVLENPKPLTICFLEGDADLSHAAAPSHPLYHDVLVSHAGADHHLGLRAGDRLVSVDGMHPIEWARSLVTTNWSQPAISNHRTFAEIASNLRSTISRYANAIVVIRCDSAQGSCAEPETISIAELALEPVDTPVDAVACDNRPLRHLADSPASHQGAWDDVFYGIVNESDETERIYGVEWESLMTNGNDYMGPALRAAVNAIRADGRGAIFDHRTGNGGTSAGAAIIWDFAASRHPLDVFQFRQRAEDEQPTLAEGMALFEQAFAEGTMEYAGSSSPTTMPVALLLTEDVSASDWLPLGLQGAPTVRSFGPYETNGAFSTRFMLTYWFGMQVVLAVGDTFVADGRSLNGTGVVPDELVLPRQSDLLAGTDTVFTRALEWVRGELP